MGDVGEYFRDTKDFRKSESKARRESNLASSIEMLNKNGISFDDKGYHVIVSHNGMKVDFWPSTGKFNIRGTPKYLRGVRLLIKLVRGDYSESDFKNITGSKAAC